MALLLLHRHATVTICHSRTRDLPPVAAEADILVAAIGRAGFVTPAFVKPGAAVVDVGTSQVSDRALVERLFPPGSKRREVFERRGSIVVGDVHPDVAEVAGALSPVPGGVGPLTIAMLLKNTLLRQREGRMGRIGGRQVELELPPAPCRHRRPADVEDRTDGRHRHRQELRARSVPAARRAVPRRGRTGARRDGRRDRGHVRDRGALRRRHSGRGRRRRSQEARADRVRGSGGAPRARGDRAPRRSIARSRPACAASS